MEEKSKLRPNCLTKVTSQTQILGYIKDGLRAEYIQLLLDKEFITPEEVETIEFQVRSVPYANSENY